MNKTRHPNILSIAGQTAGPIGLKFFVDFNNFSKIFSRATPGLSASIK